MSTILEEALLDIEQIKKAVEEEAKNKLVESLTPQIRDFINKKIYSNLNEETDKEQEEEKGGDKNKKVDDEDGKLLYDEVGSTEEKPIEYEKDEETGEVNAILDLDALQQNPEELGETKENDSEDDKEFTIDINEFKELIGNIRGDKNMKLSEIILNELRDEEVVDESKCSEEIEEIEETQEVDDMDDMDEEVVYEVDESELAEAIKSMRVRGSKNKKKRLTEDEVVLDISVDADGEIEDVEVVSVDDGMAGEDEDMLDLPAEDEISDMGELEAGELGMGGDEEEFSTEETPDGMEMDTEIDIEDEEPVDLEIPEDEDEEEDVVVPEGLRRRGLRRLRENADGGASTVFENELAKVVYAPAGVPMPDRYIRGTRWAAEAVKEYGLYIVLPKSSTQKVAVEGDRIYDSSDSNMDRSEFDSYLADLSIPANVFERTTTEGLRRRGLRRLRENADGGASTVFENELAKVVYAPAGVPMPDRYIRGTRWAAEAVKEYGLYIVLPKSSTQKVAVEGDRIYDSSDSNMDRSEFDSYLADLSIPANVFERTTTEGLRRRKKKSITEAELRKKVRAVLKKLVKEGKVKLSQLGEASVTINVDNEGISASADSEGDGVEEPIIDTTASETIEVENDDELSIAPTPEFDAAMAENKKYKVVVNKMNKKLVEANLVNAKLIYANKLLMNKGVTKKEKARIIESLDRAKSLREVQLLYKTFVNESKERNGPDERSRKPLAGGSSASTSVLKEGKEVSDEDSVNVSRWQKLANIE